MKPIFNLVIFTSISCILFISLTSAVYENNFKINKKNVDSFTIITPIANVLKNDGEKITTSISLSDKNKSIIETVSKRMLKAKYHITEALSEKWNSSTLTEIYKAIDSSGKSLQNISYLDLLDKIYPSVTTRYIIFLHYESSFNPNFETNYNTKRSLFANTIILNKSTFITTSYKLLIFDTKDKIVVYYNTINTKNYDPRLESDVEEITKKILKPIYYR
jgi:hypothetical protein